MNSRSILSLSDSRHPAPRNIRFFSAFTLVELLTVIAIIGILAAIIVPTVSAVRQSARQAQAVSHLRQTGLGVLVATDDNKGRFPPAAASILNDANGVKIRENANFAFFIRPYLGFDSNRALNASRLLVDPLVPASESSTIGWPPTNENAIGSTYAANARLMGTAATATADLGSVIYNTNHRGVLHRAVIRPTQIIMVGSAVIMPGTSYGANNTLGYPGTITTGQNIDEVIPPEPGNTPDEGGHMSGIAYRASRGTAAMFVMVDGSVRIIPKGEVKVGHFAAEL
ncbi:N-terminal cleavage protein [Opitutaceae bacterium TAV5]|nr:N-terminal cleavage protein [Opitutaceae bacterium TAV5]